MNTKLKQAYQELQQQYGPMVVYEDNDDWAEVALDENETGQSDEFVLVHDPQAYAASEASTEELEKLWLDRNKESAVETARTLCFENAVADSWSSALRDMERGYSDEFVRYWYDVTTVEKNGVPNVLSVLADYASENPDYWVEGLKKPKQRLRKRYKGDKDPVLTGPTDEEWNQMSMEDRLDAAKYPKPTAANIRWGIKEWRRILEERGKAGDLELTDSSYKQAADYAEWSCANYSEDDLLDNFGENLLPYDWRDDVAEYLAGTSDADALQLTYARDFDVQRTPSGVYWWRIE